ncbi:MAG: 2-amino-4-hydroxy-6-hydroxymethyldihydropteridine diphosphokinase [Clostridia bacterium]|nr:2-amino-4-hydroxy-6-hydroxymethyldihydropteridine diphosphokinase [Clostridia bacterium]
MKKAYLSIGTNLGDRLANLQDAVDALRLLPRTEVIKCSAVYETAPWGYAEQADFYNICVMLETELSPHALLGACLGIEAAMGRVRTFKNAPRRIDIDMILYEGVELHTEELTVPHREMKNRAFVLAPLAELTDEYASLLETVGDQKIDKTDICIL